MVIAVYLLRSRPCGMVYNRWSQVRLTERGTVTGAGYFWPGWVLLGWGVLLSLDAWKVFYQRPVTDADVEAEMQRHTPSP